MISHSCPSARWHEGENDGEITSSWLKERQSLFPPHRQSGHWPPHAPSVHEAGAEPCWEAALVKQKMQTLPLIRLVGEVFPGGAPLGHPGEKWAVILYYWETPRLGLGGSLRGTPSVLTQGFLSRRLV